MIDRKATPIRPPLQRPHVKMEAVESSSIKAIGHHAKSNTLRVEFHSGGIYDYPNTTAAEHEALMKADSHGKHFIQMIRHRAFIRLDKAA